MIEEPNSPWNKNCIEIHQNDHDSRTALEQKGYTLAGGSNTPGGIPTLRLQNSIKTIAVAPKGDSVAVADQTGIMVIKPLAVLSPD